MAPHLTEADVARCLPYPDLVDTLEMAFRDLDRGQAGNHPRQRFFLERTVFHHMGAHWDARGTVGTKTYVSGKHGTRFRVELHDSRTGELLATMDADTLGRRRTGAATALAARHMAIAEPKEAAILGSGAQARTQLEALAATFPTLDRIRVWSRTPRRAEAFAMEVSPRIARQVVACATVERAVENADIVACATAAREPILTSDRLSPHVFVAAVGANRLAAREIDESVVETARIVAVDDVEQARTEAMELHAAHQRLRFRWEAIVPLCEIVGGTRVGRPTGGGRTLFKSLGIALEDIAAATLVWENHKRRNEGGP